MNNATRETLRSDEFAYIVAVNIWRWHPALAGLIDKAARAGAVWERLEVTLSETFEDHEPETLNAILKGCHVIYLEALP